MPDLDVTKKPHIKSDYTEEHLTHLIQCVDDPHYFITNFVKIQHPTRGAIKFEMYPYQVDLINAFHFHRFSVALTARQMGKTTCAAAYLLWRAMFSPDTTILIVANKYVQALEIMDRVRYAYENLPDYIRAGVIEYNKGTVAFDNGSKIISRATSGDAGRGLSITLLYCDEFAFLAPNKQKDFWTSVQPTLATGGSCIITSTPKNDEDIFAQIWKGAIDNTDEFGNPNDSGVGKNGFFPIKVAWWAHPERDEEWARPFRQSLGEARFRQEMEGEFITDDETLINPLTLARMSGKEPEYYTGTVRWYEEPKDGHKYLVSLDPSLGTGRDYAAIQIFELPSMTQVAEWQHNHTPPRGQVRTLIQILLFLDDVLRNYSDSDPEIFWTVENNSIGEAILQIIEDTGEEQFPGIFISEPKKKGHRRQRKGMHTDNRKKLSACSRMKSLIETDRMKIYSSQLIRQLKYFVAREASFAAKPGEHDDLVMATTLICRMLDVVLRWDDTNDDLKEAISESEIFDDPLPVVL